MTTAAAQFDPGEATGTPAGAWTQLWSRLRRKRIAMLALADSLDGVACVACASTRT